MTMAGHGKPVRIVSLCASGLETNGLLLCPVLALDERHTVLTDRRGPAHQRLAQKRLFDVFVGALLHLG